MRDGARHLAATAAVVLGAAAPAPGASWRLEQPPPPPGARFKVPLGPPGDLKFWAPNRGLLSLEGTSTTPRGLLVYDGRSWRQLATVCGGTGDTSRIAWAGPTEFWVVTEPSRPRTGSGLGLCRFKDGAVVASYSTPEYAGDPFRPMNAAACNGPDDCWFGGGTAVDADGVRRGSFHLHWDGTRLVSNYGPQGRGVSDIVPFGGGWYESMLVGAQRENRTDPVHLAEEEPFGPVLVHRLEADGVWRNANFVAGPRPGEPRDSTELLAADATADQLWFGGGGAASGPSAPPGGAYPRPPIAVRLFGDFLQEVPIDETQFRPGERFVDVAAVPGTSDAWMASQPFADRASRSARARAALVHADGRVEITELPTSGAGRGAAARVAFTSPTEGWLVTTAGWLFRYTDGTELPRDTDPAFARTITFRPNEAAPQFVPDTPPEDDSQLFAPPPVEVVTEAAAPPPPPGKPLKPMLRDVRRPKLRRIDRKRSLLVLKAFVVRPGKVQLKALRRGRLVAKTRLWPVRRGPATLRLVLEHRRWPTALRFVVREKGAGAGDGGTTTTGGDGDTITTR